MKSTRNHNFAQHHGKGPLDLSVNILRLSATQRCDFSTSDGLFMERIGMKFKTRLVLKLLKNNHDICKDEWRKTWIFK